MPPRLWSLLSNTPKSTPNKMFSFVLTALAVWRLSSLLVNEDGPGDILSKIRVLVGVEYDEYSRPYATNVLAGILTCVWCCSIWVSLIGSVLTNPRNFTEYLRNALALSAGAIIIEEIVNAEKT